MFAVAGVTTSPSPAARARAMDHDQPTAKSTSIATETTLKIRSALPGDRRNPRGRCSGKASIHSPGVDLRGGGVELERLSFILPHQSGLMQAIIDLFHR